MENSARVGMRLTPEVRYIAKLNNLSSYTTNRVQIRHFPTHFPKCGKIQQLKQRMEDRRVKRRQRNLAKVDKCSNNEIETIHTEGFGEMKISNSIFSRQNDYRRGHDKLNELNQSDSNKPVLQTIPLHSDFQNITKQVNYKKSELNSHHVVSKQMKLGSDSKTYNVNDYPEDEDYLSERSSEDISEEASQDGSVVNIELIYCKHCDKSYAPATYKKFCQAVDGEGNPKCLSLRNNKRKIFNSAKVR